MNIQKLMIPVASVALVGVSFSWYGLPGLAISLGALVMWVLLHFNRMMQILKRAAQRPMGYVDSAVMLNAKLRPGVTLMHVLAMTRALGELRSAKDAQPEVFRWTDGTLSRVDCDFVNGKLVKWSLSRPVQQANESGAESQRTSGGQIAS